MSSNVKGGADKSHIRWVTQSEIDLGVYENLLRTRIATY
jgi:hypothetical protein